MNRSARRKPGIPWAAIVAGALFSTALAAPLSAADPAEVVPLVGGDAAAAEQRLEAFLSPEEFPSRRFHYVSQGKEAEFSLDSSLGATDPFAELHPERLEWPFLAGLVLRSESLALKLKPAFAGVDDALLDQGFSVRWTLVPLGLRFEPVPGFAMRVVGAEVVSDKSGKRLFFWEEPAPPPVCRDRAEAGAPKCELDGVGREARALALSPDGRLLALALGGLRPRLEVYDITAAPRLRWLALFAANSGGPVETAFSADGEWVVALTGQGRMHRFDAGSGGRHMRIPSAGRTARAIPPGRIMAVAGGAGEVTLWYLSDGTIAWSLPPRSFRGPIDRLAASADGNRFATLEYEKESTAVRVWQVKNRDILAQIKVDPYAVADIALDETGERLYIAHEKAGLLEAEVRNGAEPRPVGGEDGKRCRGRIQWIAGLRSVGCAVPGGELRIDPGGRPRGALRTGIPSGESIVAASADGRRAAAVGGGRLVLWWNE